MSQSTSFLSQCQYCLDQKYYSSTRWLQQHLREHHSEQILFEKRSKNQGPHLKQHPESGHYVLPRIESPAADVVPAIYRAEVKAEQEDQRRRAFLPTPEPGFGIHAGSEGIDIHDISSDEELDRDDEQVTEEVTGRRIETRNRESTTHLLNVEALHKEGNEHMLKYVMAGKPIGERTSIPAISTSPDANEFSPFPDYDTLLFTMNNILNNVSGTHVETSIKEGRCQGLRSKAQYDKYVRLMEYDLDMHSWSQGSVCFDPFTPDKDVATLRISNWWYRDPVHCIQFLLKQALLAPHMVWAPIRELDELGQRIYSDMHTGTYWWNKQYTLPVGGTLIPIVLGSDQTHYTNFSGDKKGWPLYLSIGNIPWSVRKKVSSRTTVLLALLPVPPKVKNLTGGALKRQQDTNADVARQVQQILWAPLEKLYANGRRGDVVLDCADGYQRRCFLSVSIWIGDYMENIAQHSIMKDWCPVCELEPKEFDHGSIKGKTRRWGQYKRLVDLYNDPSTSNENAAKIHANLKEFGVNTRLGTVWGLKCFDQKTMIVPDILHTLHLGLQKHEMEWITGFTKDEGVATEFDAVWTKIENYCGLTALGKEYNQVSQWNGREMRFVANTVHAVFAGVLRNRYQGKETPEHVERAIACVGAYSALSLYAGYHSHNEETLNGMDEENAVFQKLKHVFGKYRVGKRMAVVCDEWVTQLKEDIKADRENADDWDDLTTKQRQTRIQADNRRINVLVREYLEQQGRFNFPKMHFLSHLTEYIRLFGHLPSMSSELQENLHKRLKDNYRMTNKKEFNLQIIRRIANQEWFTWWQSARVSTALARDLVPNRHLNPDTQFWPDVVGKKSRYLGIDTISGACGVSTSLMIEHLSLFAIKYHEKAEYSTYQSHSANPLSYARFKFAPGCRIYVRSFQAHDTIAVQNLKCTRDLLWQKKAPRNDNVLVFTGFDEEEYQSTSYYIPAKLIAIFYINEPTHGFNMWTAMIDTWAIESFDRTREKLPVLYRPSGIPRKRGNWPNIQGGTRYLVPLVAIKSGAHIVPWCADENRVYLNVRIDANTFNLIY